MKNVGFVYPAKLSARRGTIVVCFRDLPEALTEGDDKDDALVQAEDCLEEAVAGRIRRGDKIPSPSAPRRGEKLVALSAPMAAKTALYLALQEVRVSKVDLAARLGCDEKEVRRLLDPRHPSKLPRLERALALLGKRLVVEMQAA